MPPTKTKLQIHRTMDQLRYQNLQTETEKQTYIQERKKKSLKKYQDRKDRQAAKRAVFDAGWECVKEDLRNERNELQFFKGDLFGFPTVAVAKLCTVAGTDRVYYHVGFSICSPRDTFSWKAGICWAASRLVKDSKHPYSFKLRERVSGAVKPPRLAQLIRTHLEMDVVAPQIVFPMRMFRRGVSGKHHSHMRFVKSCIGHLKNEREGNKK